ncbi:MAG: acetate kinase [Lachnospiraceae bacterium]|nr:acetate kinase [Lachnospiraceae bacterium]MBR2996371.1 acetate kinase [Lachnospiraceae bacterium]
MNILVINCGSSSLKFQVINPETEDLLAKGLCERIGIDGSITYEAVAKGLPKVKKDVPIEDHKKAVSLVLEALTDPETGVISSLDEIGAVGHRIVHGGERYNSTVLIDDEVENAIREMSELAPLHNPANLIGVDACKALMPGTPMVAVFDTAFHQTMPPKAFLYALPIRFYEDYKIRRYGFHGTSHAFVSKTAAEFLGRDLENTKIIVCHLGNGASCSAIVNGKCVDTSMGLTPLEGLIMGTRCGDLDPAIVEFISAKEGISIADTEKILNKESGVYGLSNGLSSDFRDLWKGSDEGDKYAKIALEAFSYRVAKYIGAYAAAMNGVDVIAFTAGVGENDPRIREMICSYLGYLGAYIDADANKSRGEMAKISTPDSKVDLVVIPTNEELAIAKETYAIVAKA